MRTTAHLGKCSFRHPERNDGSRRADAACADIRGFFAPLRMTDRQEVSGANGMAGLACDREDLA